MGYLQDYNKQNGSKTSNITSSVGGFLKQYELTKKPEVKKVTKIIEPTKKLTPAIPKKIAPTPVQKAKKTLTEKVKTTAKKDDDFLLEFVSPTKTKEETTAQETIKKVVTQKPISISPNQKKLNTTQLDILRGTQEKTSAKLTPQAQKVVGQKKSIKKTVSDLNEKLGPILAQIYIPAEYQAKMIRGEKVKLTAGKIIGGTIEDGIMAYMPVSGLKIPSPSQTVSMGQRVASGLKNAVTSSGLHALIKSFKEEKIEMKDLLISGGIGFYIGLINPTIMEDVSKEAQIGAKQTLKKYGFKNSDYGNANVLKSKWRQTVLDLHPDRGGNPEEYKAFIEAYNKMASAGIDPSWKFPDVVSWVKNLWKYSDKTPQEKAIMKTQADTDFITLAKSVVEKTPSIQNKLETILPIGENTPQDLINSVIKSGAETTAEGKEIIKSALEAQKSGQNIVVKPTTQPKAVGEQISAIEKEVEPVSPTVSKVSGGEAKKPVIEPQKVSPKIVSVPREQLPVGEGKVKVSKLEARLKGVIGNATEQQIKDLGLSTYKQMNKAEQITKASQYVVNNQQEALDVLRGKVDPPKGIIPESIYVAMTELAKDDITLATKLSSLQATALGQRIGILSEINKDNPVRLLNEIYKVRAKAIEKRFGKDATKKVVQSIKKEVKVSTKYDWNAFINSIPTC